MKTSQFVCFTDVTGLLNQPQYSDKKRDTGEMRVLKITSVWGKNDKDNYSNYSYFNYKYIYIFS